MNFQWPLINDNISQKDKEVLADFILNSNRFTNGPKVKEFEDAWSKWLGVKYSVMVNSGASGNYVTAAITRELKGQGGEVIVPPIGWVSDISSVVNTGFTPVFVDVDMNNIAISYENIKNAITEQTKAIVLVHCLGFNGLNQKIIDLAKEKNILLIEDCCESHGATFNNQKIGTLGDMSVFSFYFGHHITTIEGGMISTNNYEIYQLAKLFRSHGMTREVSEETHSKYYKDDLNPLFTFAVPGYNVRSTEINAVLGLEQIKRLDSNIEARIKNLDTWLKNLDGMLYYTGYDIEGNSSFTLPLILNNKDKVLFRKICHLLESEGVEYRTGTAGGGNQARQPYLKRYLHRINDNLSNADHIHEYGLYIGNHTELTEQQIKNLCEKLNNV